MIYKLQKRINCLEEFQNLFHMKIKHILDKLYINKGHYMIDDSSNNDEIDKLKDSIYKLEIAHYDYEYLSHRQNDMYKRFDIMYRDIKDDIIRINNTLASY